MDLILPAIDLIQQPLQVDHATRSRGRYHQFHSSPFTVRSSRFAVLLWTPSGSGNVEVSPEFLEFGVAIRRERGTANSELQTANREP